MVKAAHPDMIYLRRKAITAFLPHAIWQEKNGQHKILDTFLHTTRASQDPRFMWCWIIPLFATLLDRESTVSLKQAAILMSPHLLWWGSATSGHMIQLWAGAALTVPYTSGIGYSVVDTLLRIASNGSLRPHIPLRMWSWLNKHPHLPPVSTGRYLGSVEGVVQTVRSLVNTETLKSYLLLIWSEWDYLYDEGYHEMHALLREDFNGPGMVHHRGDLLQHLDHILGQLDLGLEYLQQHKPRLNGSDLQQMEEQYGKLKEVLLKVDRIALTCKHSRLIILLIPLTPANTQVNSQRSCVQFLSHVLSLSCMPGTFPPLSPLQNTPITQLQ